MDKVLELVGGGSFINPPTPSSYYYYYKKLFICFGKKGQEI